MEINLRTESRTQSGHADESPATPQLSYTDDSSTARLLEELVAQLPTELGPKRGVPQPLLEALRDHDLDHGTHLVRQLLLIAAVIHRDADERRTAEYLLRRRGEVRMGTRSSDWLLSSVRCAAEMDLRRTHARETAVPDEVMAYLGEQTLTCRPDAPSAGEAVLDFLRRVADYAPDCDTARDRLLDAVAIAMEVAERHWLKRGKGPSVLAMRSDARREARLVTHLREAITDAVASRCIARVLVGSDDAPIDSSLLWWAAGAGGDCAEVPERTRERWRQDLRCAERALVASIGLAA